MKPQRVSDISGPAALAADLERFLGDPATDDGPFGYAQAVAHEENGALPPGAVDLLRSWGYPRYLVPEEFGGALHDLEQLAVLTRVVARRNMTVAVVFGSTLLGAVPVWLWGNAEQRAVVARGLLDGALVCCAVSEPDHGSDLAGNETTAARSGDELVLRGEKWPVGNAVRGRFVTVYATVAPVSVLGPSAKAGSPLASAGSGSLGSIVTPSRRIPKSCVRLPYRAAVNLNADGRSRLRRKPCRSLHPMCAPGASMLGCASVPHV